MYGLVFASLAIAVVSANLANEACKPGESFMDYCNSCRCGSDGLRKNAICTRKGCPPGIWNQDGSLINPEQQINDSTMRNKRQANDHDNCVTGSVKKIDCNTCRCVGESAGRWACTKMECA